MTTGKKEFHEDVIQEYPAIGKYRIRLVQSTKDDGTKRTPALDIREYVTQEGFEGFTRRGIRLTTASQMDNLKEILVQVLTSGHVE